MIFSRKFDSTIGQKVQIIENWNGGVFVVEATPLTTIVSDWDAHVDAPKNWLVAT